MEGEKSLSRIIVITVHPVLHADEVKGTVDVNVSPVSFNSLSLGVNSTALCFSPTVLPLRSLEQLFSWEIKDSLFYTLHCRILDKLPAVDKADLSGLLGVLACGGVEPAAVACSPARQELLA